ncbi:MULTISPECIES: hypothetical protein [unclassified Bradyrhizobium]|nr:MULTISPECIES: hypothetical protein [unclassified Bradyrhizobium]
MAWQPRAGKVKRIATMLHGQGYKRAPLNLASIIAGKTTAAAFSV